jgi:hypothetical protein
MPRLRATVCILTLLLLVTGGAVGQDAKAPSRGRSLPQYWSRLGLSEDQKQEAYKIQSDYRSKIEALQAQIKDLQKKQSAALEKILTDPQKARLREIIASKVPGGDEPRKGAEKSPPPDKEEKKP